MLKTIETTEKVILQKLIQLPVDIAAEVLTCYCNNKTTAQCVLLGKDAKEEVCPFAAHDCRDITVDMWEDYLSE